MAGSVETYRMIRVLGRGGMAETYEAESASGARVCIKRMLSVDEDRGALAHEASLAIRLEHPNVVQLFGHRTVRLLGVAGDSDRPSLIYELVDGISLAELLEATGGPLPSNVVAHLGRELAAALEHAHGMSVVHRDISPSNILLGMDGEVKLADFGIGKIATTAYVTQSNRFMGKALYVAPEVFAQAETIGIRSDLYSLGVVLQKAATGGHPYVSEGESVFEMMSRMQSGARVSVLEQRPDVDAVLAGLIDALTPVDSSARYDSAASVAEDLASVATGGEHHLRLLVRGVVSTRRPASSQRAQRRMWALGGAAVLAVLATGFVVGRPVVTPQTPRALVAAAVSPPASAARATPAAQEAAPAPTPPPVLATRPATPASAGTALLRVTVVPIADVAIDGRYVGRSPTERVVTAGIHVVRAWIGGTVIERSVRVMPPRAASVRIEFPVD